MGLTQLSRKTNGFNLSSDISALNVGTWGGGGSHWSPLGDFDKNAGTTNASSYVDTAANWMSEISNALGYRAPMYTIGEIPADSWVERNSEWFPDAFGSAVRAIGSLFGKEEQDGVIIDGLSDFGGKFAMDLPKNSMLYRLSGVTDQRVRTPSELKMKVYISNHLSDDIVGAVTNQIKSMLPGVLDGVVDNLLRKGGNTRAQQALYNLRWIQENGRPFKVYTPHCVFDNMIIKDITFETGDDTMDTLVAEITFSELLMYAPLGDISSQPKRESVINNQTSGYLSRWTEPVKGLF